LNNLNRIEYLIVELEEYYKTSLMVTPSKEETVSAPDSNEMLAL
jgi:hypothetical protein